MKIIFLGTPSFVVPVLENLAKKHEILAVFCQPDKPGNRNKITVSPVKEFAQNNNILVFTPNKIDDEVIEQAKSLCPDVMVCCAYGRILPQKFIDICPILNVHPSDLPKYRGSSPVQWALINGEREIVVTVMKMCFKMDAGEMLLKQPLPVLDEDNSETILKKSFILGSEMLDKVLENFEFYLKNVQVQNEEYATVCPMLKKEDGKINFEKPAKSIENLVRGLYMWPVAYCTLNGKNFKIFKAKAQDDTMQGIKTGQVIACDKSGVKIACGEGVLTLLEVQIEGAKRMMARDFVNGNQIKVGDILC